MRQLSKEREQDLSTAFEVVSRTKHHLDVPDHGCLMGAAVALKKRAIVAESRSRCALRLLAASLTLSVDKRPELEALMLEVNSLDFCELHVLEDLERLQAGKKLKHAKVRIPQRKG